MIHFIDNTNFKEFIIKYGQNVGHDVTPSSNGLEK